MSFKLMPFVRVGKIIDSNSIQFMKAGEGINNEGLLQSYNWPNYSLSETDCLIITETIDGRNNAFSGRATKITENSTTTMTFEEIGTLGAFDYVLPAPSSFLHYRYLGCVYMDTAEVRNISDSGSIVKAKMIDLGSTNSIQGHTGSIGNGTRIEVGGYIPPLATSTILDIVASLETTSVGDVAEYFDADNSKHLLQSTYYTKTSAFTETYVHDGITIPFSFCQNFYLATAGSLAYKRSRVVFSVTGWIEP